jgi:N-acyl-phosphatidylethanolamine-hydrolysing phospholipase D
MPAQPLNPRFYLGIAALILLAGCHGKPNYSPMKKHHTADGFRNNYPHEGKQSFWKWQWERWTGTLPQEPAGGYNFPLRKPDLAYLAANRSDPALTWIGHATFLLQLGGVNILTDPHLTERASPLSFAGPKRHVAPALDFPDLPHIDAVVISHSHYDHLDLGTVKRLNQQSGGPPMFFVPLELKAWFLKNGIHNVAELDWWESREHMGLKFHLVPVQHWSARSLWDRNRTLWGAWVVEHPDLRFLFGGDFGYSKDLADIGRHFGHIDIAALPIGAYEPRWFMHIMHVNPDEAVRAHRDLNARYSVGMHWGTFKLTDELLDEPPKRLAHALDREGIPREKFFVMEHGETRNLAFIRTEAASGPGNQGRAAAR